MTALYQASSLLESAIVMLAPRWTTAGSIAQDWPELQAWHAATGYQYSAPSGSLQAITKAARCGLYTHDRRQQPIVVHQAGTGPEHNIFTRKAIHCAFRAWHDWLHLVTGSDFTNAGELAVCKAHIWQLRQLDVPARDRRAVWAFVAGEVDHYWQHLRFIDLKAEFVTYALEHGVPAAVKLPWFTQGD